MRPVRNIRKKDGRRRKGRRPSDRNREFDRKVISIRRVAKVRAGAKRLRFSVLVVVGDRKGRVGIGLGRSGDTRSSIEKAVKYATAHLMNIALIGDTIPHEVEMKFRAAKVIIKPAGPGTGVIASNAVRSVMELAGVRNVLTKQLGSRSPINNTYCTLKALESLDKRRIVARQSARLKSKLETKKDAAAHTEKKDK